MASWVPLYNRAFYFILESCNVMKYCLLKYNDILQSRIVESKILQSRICREWVCQRDSLDLCLLHMCKSTHKSSYLIIQGTFNTEFPTHPPRIGGWIITLCFAAVKTHYAGPLCEVCTIKTPLTRIRCVTYTAFIHSFVIIQVYSRQHCTHAMNLINHVCHASGHHGWRL